MRTLSRTLAALPVLALMVGCGDALVDAGPMDICSDPQSQACLESRLVEQAFPGRPGEERTAIVTTQDGEEEEITYQEIDGAAIYQGDIRLRTTGKLDSQLESVGIELRSQRWPDRIVYYDIDPTLPNQTRVSDAIAHWELNTDMVFVERTSQSDYVYFTNSTGCSSSVGRVGGRQDINLSTGKSVGQIRGMAIAKSNDYVYAWYDDGMVSAGTSTSLDAYHAQYAYTLPPGYTVSNIVEMAIAPGDKVYTWFDNGKYTIGTSADLDYYAGPQSYSLPAGYSISQIVGLDFSSAGKLYAWYTNNTATVGTTSDLDAYSAPYSATSGQYTWNAIAMGIAGSTDYVYTWYASGNGSVGTSSDLDQYNASFAFSPPSDCSTGNTIHEIGHAVGLYHEQGRCDRDASVNINTANIIAGFESNFDKHCGTEGRDLGAYDFGSIMHYGSFAFSSNGNPTIVKKDGSTFTVQRNGLSPIDIQGVAELYGYSPASGRTPLDIKGMGIASNDYVYTWYDDGKVSYGRSYDLDDYASVYNYTLPSGQSPANIAAMAIAKSTNRVYTWYDNGKVSVGTSSDLDAYQAPIAYSMPSGYLPQHVVGIGIAPNGDKVYTYYNNGKMSIGNSTDLDAYQGPTTFALPPGKAATDIVEIDIAATTSYVYAWFDDYDLSIGSSVDLDLYQETW